MRILAFILPLLLVAGCKKGNDEETGLDTECGDIDGNGGDTGDVPNVLGLWTANFGLNLFDENCSGVDDSDIGFVNGPIEINGYVPDGLRLDFGSDSDRRLRGAISTTGGMAFAGQIEQSQGIFHFGMGGLVYEDQNMGGRNVWMGGGYVGVDVDKDGAIDCDMRGDWTVMKSGS